MIDNAPQMNAAQFSQLARIVHEESGISLPETKRGLLAARISRRLRILKMDDFSAYCGLLSSAQGVDERRNLITAITTNVTAFFRESHHFDFMTREILPGLIAQAKNGGRVRIWSAACSSGEEAYSIAMSVLDVFPDVARYDFLILASDIDPLMIQKANDGCYSDHDLRGFEPAKRDQYFARSENGFEVRAHVRKILRFAELNLHGEWPFRGRFDVIFCRNVVIYFDTPLRQKLWSKFAERLNQTGHLLIGHSERIDGPAANSFRLVGPTTYQLSKSLAPTQ